MAISFCLLLPSAAHTGTTQHTAQSLRWSPFPARPGSVLYKIPSTFLDIFWEGDGVEINSHIVQADLELTTFLPQPPKG